MKKGIEELKSYFRKGCRPTEEQFIDLIDSTYNDDKASSVLPHEPEPTAQSEDVEQASCYKSHSVAADGEWHNIPHDKSQKGLQLYRVIASYKNSRKSKCYICEVIASQHDSTSSELSSHKRRWWGWRGPIEFRWRSYLGLLHLQIRCRPAGGYRDKVYCQIVQLWDGKADNNE